MPEHRFITPLDVLYPRGNRLFGDAGQHGEANMPPWPSAVAGAIRSRMLADAEADFSEFARGAPLRRAELRESLGTPANPGVFRITWFSLARRVKGAIEPILALPSDLSAAEGEDGILYLNPQVVPPGLKCSALTPQLPILRRTRAAKPEGGIWLTCSGIAAYLQGKPLRRKVHTLRTGDIWKADLRTGIALDPQKRSAAEGRLYTTDAVAMNAGVGFLVRIEGADGLVPRDGLVRLGGDGRGAQVEVCDVTFPEPDWDRIVKEKSFRLVLTAPGLFESFIDVEPDEGESSDARKGNTCWLPTGIQGDGTTWRGPDDIAARLICAAVPRALTVSGWDMAARMPKQALRAAPTGSVYWFEDFEGKVGGLRRLAKEGFGCLSRYPDPTRQAEGFNTVMVANWVASSE